jgi:hypothetical protein
MRIILGIGCIFALALASCGGTNVDLGGTHSSPLKSDGSGDAGNSDSGGACKATCGTPAGAVQQLTSVADVYAAVAGSWQICSGQENLRAPADVIGIELTPGSTTPTPNGSTKGGLMYYLVQGASGPVRGQGFDYQLTYDVSPESPGYQFNYHTAEGAGRGGQIAYSPCPREMIFPVTYTNGVVLVAY